MSSTSANRSSWALENGVLAIVLAVTLLLAIPPWPDFFASGLGLHWDTHLMGQWMAWNAHNILDGKFLIPDFNANFFYPHAYTLAFSEPLWPQSYIYAVVYGLTKNPFLSFNTTLLAFWVLSGLLMAALLRELGLNRGAGVIGAFIYCLMPYRLGYYIEFNMSLVFIMPLMLLVTVRWLRQPGLGRSIWWGLAFWISATSCLYYTIMMLTPVIAISVVSLLRKPVLLRQPRNWVFALLVCASVVAVAMLYLYPYYVLRVDGGFVRTLNDYSKHFAQATQYLSPRAAQQAYNALGLPMPDFNVRWTEAVAFPGTALAILVFVHYAGRVRRFGRSAVGMTTTAFNGARALLWMAFWTVVVVSWSPWAKPVAVFSASLVWWLALVILIISVLHLFVAPKDESDHAAMVRALGVGAVVCFFLSLGPEITVGKSQEIAVLASNPARVLFEDIPIYGAVRGLSRFTIVVLTFLVIVACFTLSTMVHRRPGLWVVAALVPVLLVFEARQVFYRFADDGRSYNRPVAKALRTMPEDATAGRPHIPALVQLPLGLREVDSSATLLSIGAFNKLVNGHSGFVHRQYRHWMRLQNQWNIDGIAREMQHIWPLPWLLVDNIQLRSLADRKGQTFPDKSINRHWTLHTEDSLYKLYRPKNPGRPEKLPTHRVLRSDVLAENRVLKFFARSSNPKAKLAIKLNNVLVEKLDVNKDWTALEVKLPVDYTTRLVGDTVRFRTAKGVVMHIKEVRFEPPSQ